MHFLAYHYVAFGGVFSWRELIQSDQQQDEPILSGRLACGGLRGCLGCRLRILLLSSQDLWTLRLGNSLALLDLVAIGCWSGFTG